MVLSSAIVCDHDRLRSSAITIAGSQAIAEVRFHMIADDRRTFCDPRSSAIIWKPAFNYFSCSRLFHGLFLCSARAKYSATRPARTTFEGSRIEISQLDTNSTLLSTSVKFTIRTGSVITGCLQLTSL